MDKIEWIKTGFIECDTCRAKPGSPALCAGCLHNRRVISTFHHEYNNLKKMIEDIPGQSWDSEYLPPHVIATRETA